MTLIARLNASGFEAWLVGGAVRDAYLNVDSLDWDIATSAPPSSVELVFSDYHVIPIGVQHGTVRVVTDDMEVDITTYRVDGDYKDGRHPDSISFVSSLDEDLARRDFTMNAMAYHPLHGLYDPYHGVRDLDDRLIRAVGDPAVRLAEDYLRIMRAIRFVAIYDFALEQKLAEAIEANAASLQTLPVERLGLEWTKLLFGAYAGKAVAAHFATLRHSLRLGFTGRPFMAWRALDKLNEPTILRHVAFAMALELPASWFNALYLTKDVRRRALQVRSLHQAKERPADDDFDFIAWRMLGAAYSLATLNDYCSVRIALTDEDLLWQRLKEKIAIWRESGLVTLADLAITGETLSSVGIRPNERAKALWRLFRAVAANELGNEQDALRNQLKVWYNH